MRRFCDNRARHFGQRAASGFILPVAQEGAAFAAKAR
jgi:hypothetical protein